MPAAPEIILPETTPETEWILGRAVQKVSPRRKHALVTCAVLRILGPWARDRGELGPEWRFRIQPPGEIIRPLIPDIAFVSYERLGDLTGEERELPQLAPNVVFEVRSPDDRWRHIEHKIDVYLRAGTDVVILVDPDRETLTAYDTAGEHMYAGDAIFEHPGLPEFSCTVADVFEVLHRPRPQA